MGPSFCRKCKNELDYNKESYDTGLCSACRRRLKAKEPVNIADWFQKKRQRIEKKGLLSRYHIIDTYSKEWNSLTGASEFLLIYEIHDEDTFPVSKEALKELGVNRVVKCFGIWWLIRFNS